jgi:hypothetical protein
VSVGRLLAEVVERGLDPPAGFPDPRSLPTDLDAGLCKLSAAERWRPYREALLDLAWQALRHGYRSGAARPEAGTAADPG